MPAQTGTLLPALQNSIGTWQALRLQAVAQGLADAGIAVRWETLPGFRARRPRLTRWLDAFASRKSMLATPLSGETHD